MKPVDAPLPPAADLPAHPDFLWRNPEPKKHYDVIIVGGGGHGLATAHYLAANHGITNVAVLEKGWLAGGNMARNTTIIRSNYLWDESAGIYEHALKLWEGLEEELDYPILFSQRGVLNLAHTLQDVRDSVRRVNANQLNGVDAEWVDADGVKELCPIVNTRPDIRYPVLGATYQPRAGIAKHDYVAWGFARSADRAGVDLIQNTAVTGFLTEGDRVVGVRTSQGDISAGAVALAAAGSTSLLTDGLGIKIPIQSHPLQALVSELLEPVHPTVVMSNAVHVYVSQAPQGRARDGSGGGQLQRLRSARLVPHHRAADGGRGGACSRSSPGPTCCGPGAASSTSPRTPRRSSASPRTTTCSSTAVGVLAVSRPPRGSAGCSRTRSPPASPTR